MNNTDILEEGIKKMIQDERIHDDYRNMITAISNLIAENKELKEERDMYRSQVNSAFSNGYIHKSKVVENINKAIKNDIDLSNAMFEGDFVNGYIYALQSLLGKE